MGVKRNVFLREEHTLEVFAGKIFVPKKGEVSKQLRIFHSEVRY
jgi:hypothetical protein